MLKPIGKFGFFFLIALVFSGCATMDSNVEETHSLRIGVTPYYPPMIFKIKEEIKGAEADFAFMLAKALGRQVRFIELDWDKQISALIEGKIDIIMSGMSITEARKARIAFTDPYLKSGLVTLMRSEESYKFDSLQKIRESDATVGVVLGTTGEAYVRKNFPNTLGVIAFPKAGDAPFLLKNMRIDIMVHDAPSIVWLVSENEGILKGFWQPLTEEYMGWGVSREDPELLRKVNTVLRTWKQDGTLKEVLSKWLPYWKNFD